ncbi:hypothetical protein [Streptomyces sp. NPDC048638]|uniref:hypothetical protein n=1 Tax=Streptomyces sp. NPDC048638 TaxID=3365580 RepID=UPI00371778DE
MDEYAGRVLAERYRLPLRPAGDEDFAETRAFDTYSGQEVLLRQVPLPEVVEAEVVGDPGFSGAAPGAAGARTADRSPRDPAVRRALDAVTAAAQVPDHPLLDQVFDAFAQDGSLWIAGELIPARPLSALLAEEPLDPYRAAEIAADVLTALRALHAHGRLHRNITARTVLVCDDGRAILSGLAVGAAQEALCGYEAAPRETAPQDGTPQDGTTKDGTTKDAAPASRREPAGAAGSTHEAVARAAFDPYSDHLDPGELPAPRRESAPEDGKVLLVKAPHASSYGRPTAGLAAERAWQARLQTVGPVTERWAPEQAEPPQESGGATAVPGPATDLWAVGALLFRTVQGHPPFPEENSAELAELVRSQPPAEAGECGEELSSLVASLLRRDPAGRPDAEEVRGRLRELIRTAPEPDIGRRLVTVPALGQGTDGRRLPIVRRRGELVRKGRHKKQRARGGRQSRPVPPAAAASPAAAPASPVVPVPRPPRPPKQPKPLHQPRSAKPPRPARAATGAGPSAAEQPHDEQQLLVQVGLDTAPRPARDRDAERAPGGRGPRHLGRLLLALVLLLLVGAVVYAMVFMPKSGAEAGAGGAEGTGVAGAASGGSPAPTEGRDGGPGQSGEQGGGQAPQPTEPAHLAKGFRLLRDPEGFQVAVHQGWQRRGRNDRGQVRYVDGDYELLIVPGRDTTAHFGTDPMAYQQDKEGELAPYRGSGWSSASGLRRIDVGKTAMAEGTFTWKDSSGRQVYVRNLAMIHNGRYHLVLVIGPDTGRRTVDTLYAQATSTYSPR